jgi:hypothetical protein
VFYERRVGKYELLSGESSNLRGVLAKSQKWLVSWKKIGAAILGITDRLVISPLAFKHAV